MTFVVTDKRFRDVYVMLSDTEPPDPVTLDGTMQQCALYDGPGGNGELVVITCSPNTWGRYLILYQQNQVRLGLCEVYEFEATGEVV